MRIKIKQLMANRSVLAGAANGSLLLSRLLSTVAEPNEPTALYLDFAGVDVATASFLRDGPLAYRQIVRSRVSNLYPVVANPNDTVLQELRLFVESQRDAILCCTLGAAETPSNVQLVGKLEEKHLLTFELVRELGSADTATIASNAIEKEVKPTAWNNRLAGLVQKGLLMEFQVGRTKRFSLVTSP